MCHPNQCWISRFVVWAVSRQSSWALATAVEGKPSTCHWAFLFLWNVRLKKVLSMCEIWNGIVSNEGSQTIPGVLLVWSIAETSKLSLASRYSSGRSRNFEGVFGVCLRRENWHCFKTAMGPVWNALASKTKLVPVKISSLWKSRRHVYCTSSGTLTPSAQLVEDQIEWEDKPVTT